MRHNGVTECSEQVYCKHNYLNTFQAAINQVFISETILWGGGSAYTTVSPGRCMLNTEGCWGHSRSCLIGDSLNQLKCNESVPS